MKEFRWGIMATGEIARNMAAALSQTNGATLHSVGSRSMEKAENFGKEWKFPNRFASYEELAACPDLDIVYIATPQNLHYENIKLCLKHGKHVLCEKPLTLNAGQAEECIRMAAEKNLFLMEAMWMRFFPAYRKLLSLLSEGIIGDVQVVQADFRISLPFNPVHRLYKPELGGGALLDLGIYPISLAYHLLGYPDKLHSHAVIGETNVDELDQFTLSYDDGRMAILSCGFRGYKPREAFIAGTKGYIKIHSIFFRPDRLTLHVSGNEPETVYLPFDGNGYVHEVREVQECLGRGESESLRMPLSDSLNVIKIMDSLRKDWNYCYSGETL